MSQSNCGKSQASAIQAALILPLEGAAAQGARRQPHAHALSWRADWQFGGRDARSAGAGQRRPGDPQRGLGNPIPQTMRS
jgi:hypothetical protein